MWFATGHIVRPDCTHKSPTGYDLRDFSQLDEISAGSAVPDG